MNQPVAVPADRLEVLHLVGSAVRAVLAVMDLQRPPGPAAGATTAILLHGHAAVQRIHAIDYVA